MAAPFPRQSLPTPPGLEQKLLFAGPRYFVCSASKLQRRAEVQMCKQNPMSCVARCQGRIEQLQPHRVPWRWPGEPAHRVHTVCILVQPLVLCTASRGGPDAESVCCFHAREKWRYFWAGGPKALSKSFKAAKDLRRRVNVYKQWSCIAQEPTRPA
ncbi:hypothetical protein C8R47DRAFT_1160409 [Mycena vitilis]|nr:hypothetical protein C8R47DRAFT_1160409 [Mycena vitilis]